MTAGGPGEGSATPASRPGGFWAATFCGMPFSAVDARAVLDYLEQRRPSDPFGYVVTPNVDHVVRNWRGDGALRAVYEEADLSLCDSRILGLVARLVGLRLPVVTGSDLTAILFELIINPYERVTIVGGDAQVVAQLERGYELRNIRHYNPPMGFIRDRDAVLQTAAFIERLSYSASSSSRSARRSRRCWRTSSRAAGAPPAPRSASAPPSCSSPATSQRAPVWMRRARLEWLHRLLSEPRRLWRRYLVEGPNILRLAAEQMLAQGGRKERRVQVSIVIPARLRREHLLARLLAVRRPGRAGPQELRSSSSTTRRRPPRGRSCNRLSTGCRPPSATPTSRGPASRTPATAASPKPRATSSPSSTTTSCPRRTGSRACCSPSAPTAPTWCWGPSARSSTAHPGAGSRYEAVLLADERRPDRDAGQPAYPLAAGSGRGLPPADGVEQRAPAEGALLRRRAAVRPAARFDRRRGHPLLRRAAPARPAHRLVQGRPWSPSASRASG